MTFASSADEYRARRVSTYLRRMLDRRRQELSAFVHRLERRNKKHGTIASRLEAEIVHDELSMIEWATQFVSRLASASQPTTRGAPSASVASPPAASARAPAAARAARK